MTPQAKSVRALRGAITVERDDTTLLAQATQELLTELLRRNGVTGDDVISAFFTVTEDLCSDFPARAARELGWDNVAMLCGVEMPVPGAITRCIRVLLHVELPATTTQRDVRHAYLRDAKDLRPDLQ